MMSKQTTNRLALAALCGVCFIGAPATNGAILGDLIATSGSITVGPLTFYNFTWNTACPIPASNVTVTGWTGVPFPASPEHYGIQIQGPIVAINGAVCDIAFTYCVKSSGPAIEDIYAKVVPSILGAGGVVAIGESVVDMNTLAGVAQSTVGFITPGVNDPIDPPTEVGDVVVWNPGSMDIFVTKAIFLAANAGGLVGATTIYQGFSVPEPSTYAMIAGLGLVGFALYRRMKA